MKRKKAIRIVHVITTLSTGGAEAMLYKLAKQTKRGTDVEQQIVSLSDLGHYGPMMVRLGIVVHALQADHFPRNCLHVYRLCRSLRRYKPDVLMSWLYHADLIGVILATVCRIPRVVWNLRCSNMDWSQYKRTSRYLFLLLRRLSFIPDAIIVNSAAGMDYHRRAGYRNRTFQRIPNGFDTRLFRPDERRKAAFREHHRIGPKDPVIGMVARFDPMKGHALFFRAAGLIRRACPRAHFVLVGRGMDSENLDIMRMMAANQLIDHVTLLGVRSDLEQIYPAFDLLICPSFFGEGFPNVIGEAMSCGVPVISTDVGDAALLIGDAGRIVRPNAAVEMAQGAVELLAMPAEERKRLGSTARERILTHFDIEQISDQYLDFIAQLGERN